MAGKRITTELVVKAVDQYSSMIRNMSGVTGRFAANVRTEMGSLQGMRGPLRMIEDFRRQQTVVRRSADALDAANEKTRKLLTTIRATKNPTAAMRREFERARTTAGRLEEKHRRNRAELRGLQVQMQSAGVDTSSLASEQRRLASALDAANGKFARQVERMQRLKTMQDRIAESRERMQRSLATAANLSFVGNASMQTGRRILTAMSAPIMQAVEFESAMSDVRKVVDFESPAAFRTMSEDILELSTRIPIAATGLAEIVAAGGQSGIAQEELARFAEMAAKAGVAFDMSAGSIGTSMAEIKTAFRIDLDQTGSLFDAMNHLSNNSAARADATLEFMNRAGADGENYGFDHTETLAIGAAMIAAGAGADTAATSFRNMGRALTRGESATTRQSAAMARLGLNSEDVARAMQENAVGTTMDVMQRLNELPDHLRASVMTDLFGDEARELTKLMNNMQLMPEMLALVADETQYLGSAEAEYAERSRTTANNMQLLRNQTARLGISIGEVVLPPLNELLSKSQVFIDKLVTWTKENPKLTKTLVMGGVALGAMAVAGGFLLTAAAGLIGTMAVLRFGLVGLGARAAFAAKGFGSVSSAFGGLMRLPKLALSTLIVPLRWTAGLIPRMGITAWRLFAGRYAIGGLLYPFRWTARLIGRVPWIRLAGKLALSTLIGPFRWTAGLIPRIGITAWRLFAGRYAIGGLLYPFRWTARLIGRVPWIRLAGKLALSTLIVPLRWTASLLPFFGPALGRFSGFRTSAAAEITGLSTHVRTQSAAMARNLSRIRAGALSAGVMTYLAMRNLPENPEDLAAFQETNVRSMDRGFRATPGISHLMEAYEKSFEWFHGFKPPVEQALLPTDAGVRSAAATVQIYADEDNLPTADRLEGLRGMASDLRAEISALQAEMDAIGTPKHAYDFVSSEYQQAKTQKASRVRDLETVEHQLSEEGVAAASLTQALQVLSDTSETPEISTESIDRALAKVQALAEAVRSIPAGSVGGSEGTADVQKRASGGPFGIRPLLVGERGPELYFPNRAGFIATNQQTQRLQRGAQRVRAASLAGLVASSIAVAPQAVTASPTKETSAFGTEVPRAARVEIGSINIVAPSGVSDPEGLVDLIETRLGERISATFAASFSD